MKNRMQRALADMICRERALDSSGIMGRFDDRAKLLATLVYLVAMLSTPIYRPSQLILFAIFPHNDVGRERHGLSAHSPPLVDRRPAGRSHRHIQRTLRPPAGNGDRHDRDNYGLDRLRLDRAPRHAVGAGSVDTHTQHRLSQHLPRNATAGHAAGSGDATAAALPLCLRADRRGAYDVACARRPQLRPAGLPTPHLGRNGRAAARARSACRSRAVYAAMLARGFDGSIPQCDARPCRWRLRDTALVAAWTIISAAIRLADPAGIIQTFRL